MPIRFSMRLHGRTDLHLVRKIWHMLGGVSMIAVWVITDMPRSTGVMILGSVLGFNLLVETARLKVPSLNEKVMRYMGPLMRNCEIDRLSGVPYYLSATILAVAIFPKPIAILSILYLACGDPLASLFGILFGHLGPRFSNGKSLIGTAVGVLTCALITFFFLKSLRFGGHFEMVDLAVLSIIGGLAGGLAELLPLEVDDNFSIPIVSGFLLWLGFILLGV